MDETSKPAVLPVCAATFSLLLSLLAAATDDVLNPDGMLYVDVARVFVEQGFGAALGKFNWPFLSMLIGALHVATGLSFIVASHLLDAIVLAALSAGFVLLYRESGGPRAWVAAAVIVLSPFLNEYRSYVIRDFGYWCFGLWSILFFVRFCREQDWVNALAWQLCVLAAVAFRIEAVALAALLPLYCGLLPRERLRAWLRADALFLAGLAGLAALVWLDVVPLTNLSRLQYLQSFLSWSALTEDFQGKLAVVTGHLQAAPSANDAPALLIGGAIGIFFRQIVWGLGVWVLPLAAGLWQRKLRPFDFAQDRLAGWGALPWAMTAVALPVLVFAFRDMFLSNRYPGLLILLLSLPAARMLDAYLPPLAEAWRKHPLRTGVIVAALSLWAVDAAAVTQHHKRYLRDAAEWAEARIPREARFFANDATLYFYSGRGFTQEIRFAHQPADALGGEIERSDWLLLRVRKSDREIFQVALGARPELRLAARFENQKGDAVYALRVEHPASGN
jgi:hypothetical protein